MNTGPLFDMVGMAQGCPGFTRRANAASGPPAFADKLSASRQSAHTFVQGPPIHLRMGETILCSGNVRGQSYTAEYAAGSTDEDPIVRISGTSGGGEFDFTRRIQDIDPANASYAELAALYAYLRRTGTYQSGETGALPTGMECRDIARKRNYLKELENFAVSASKSGVYPKFSPNIYSRARELLGVYRSAVQSRDAAQPDAFGKSSPSAF